MIRLGNGRQDPPERTFFFYPASNVNLLATQILRLRRYFSSGALVLVLFFPSDNRNQKRLLCRSFYGLMAAGTDECVRELPRKYLPLSR